jgi:hypothetical protein
MTFQLKTLTKRMPFPIAGDELIKKKSRKPDEWPGKCARNNTYSAYSSTFDAPQ